MYSILEARDALPLKSTNLMLGTDLSATAIAKLPLSLMQLLAACSSRSVHCF